MKPVDLARKAKVSKMVMTRLRNGQIPKQENFEKLLRAMKLPKEEARQLIILHKRSDDAIKMGKKIVGKEQRRLYAVKKIQKLYDIKINVQFGLREAHRKDSADRGVLQRPAGCMEFSPKSKDTPRFRWVFVPEFVEGEIREVNPSLEVWNKGEWCIQTSSEERELVRYIHTKVRSPHAGGIYCTAYDAAMQYANLEKFSPPRFDLGDTAYEIDESMYHQVYDLLQNSLDLIQSPTRANTQKEKVTLQLSKAIDTWEQLKHEKFLKLRIAMSFVSYFFQKFSPYEL
jgi:hypothetical protein